MAVGEHRPRQTTTPERVIRVIEKLNEPSAIVYVAADGDAILGMVLVEPYRRDDGAGEVLPDALHLSMTFIAQPFQGQRLGARLVGHALEQAGDAGVTRVSLWTGRDNTVARRLYESLGMKPTETRHITETVEWARYEIEL